MNEVDPHLWQWAIGGLCATIAGLAGYVVKLNSMDRKDRKDTHAELMVMLKNSTDVSTALKYSVEANTKTTDALHRAVSDFMRTER